MVKAGRGWGEVSGDAIAGIPICDIGLGAVLEPEDVDGVTMDICDVVLASAGLPEAVEGIYFAVPIERDADEYDKRD